MGGGDCPQIYSGSSWGSPRVFGSIRAHMCPLGAGCVCGEKGWARAAWMGTGLVY